MYEGKIIKYFREKNQLTQEQLGKGICSDTHISKIERLQTKYAPEIITLLSERLGINMNEKIKQLFQIKKRILDWQDSIVMQLKDEMDKIHSELEQEELIQISEYINLYKLLQVRYLLFQNKQYEAYVLIKELKRNETKLNNYEKNVLMHVLGIYYLSVNDIQSAMNILKNIQNEIYNNPEYFYHLAHAYHSVELPVLAYFYADKARQFFKEKNNYLRVIDAEILMNIQAQDNTYNLDIIKRFENLMLSCEICSSPERKAKVTHNLAYEYYRLRDYEQASKYYKESMMMKEKESSTYLLSLEGYIRSCYEGDLLPSSLLIHHVTDGANIAKKNKLILYIYLFKLLSYLIKGKEQAYYQYLHDKALPMFEKFGISYLIRRSYLELYNFYKMTKQNEMALVMAESLVKRISI
jgi:HTH-type transcriptional regulator, quorum sensing regulator NprR